MGSASGGARVGRETGGSGHNLQLTAPVDSWAQTRPAYDLDELDRAWLALGTWARSAPSSFARRVALIAPRLAPVRIQATSGARHTANKSTHNMATANKPLANTSIIKSTRPNSATLRKPSTSGRPGKPQKGPAGQKGRARSEAAAASEVRLERMVDLLEQACAEALLTRARRAGCLDVPENEASTACDICRSVSTLPTLSFLRAILYWAHWNN